MLVGDLVYNESFDFDCDYEIYDQQRGRGASPSLARSKTTFANRHAASWIWR